MKFAIDVKSKLPKMNEVNVLGPVLAPITKLRKKYRCRNFNKISKKFIYTEIFVSITE